MKIEFIKSKTYLATVLLLFLVSCKNNHQSSNHYSYVEKFIEFDPSTGELKNYESGNIAIEAENDSIAFVEAYNLFCTKIDSIKRLLNTNYYPSSPLSKQENSTVAYRLDQKKLAWQNRTITGFVLYDNNRHEVNGMNVPINESVERYKDSLAEHIYLKHHNYEHIQDSLNRIRKHIQDSLNAKRWETSTSIDEMTGTENIWKSLTSDNTHHFDFPYEGGSKLKLTVRYMKKYGNDVILKISSGQVLCSEYNGTNYVNIRFDDEAPMKFYTNEPADYSSDHVFLKNPTKFINKAKKAKTIKVEIPIYEEGRPIFTFTVDEPLTWDK